MNRCPDATANPDYCDVCRGWGHLCPEFRRTHMAGQVAQVESVYRGGWDPAAFYPSTAAAIAGEARTAAQRRRK